MSKTDKVVMVLLRLALIIGILVLVLFSPTNPIQNF